MKSYFAVLWSFLAPALALAQAPVLVPTQANVIKNPAEVGARVWPRTAPATVTFNLVAQEVVAEIDAGDPTALPPIPPKQPTLTTNPNKSIWRSSTKQPKSCR